MIMNLTDFYNHESFMNHVSDGCKLINNIPSGCEKQLYEVGQKVKHSSLSCILFGSGEILDVYSENGYYYYVVSYNISKRKKVQKTFLQKEITL